jgi:hypothetical protein
MSRIVIGISEMNHIVNVGQQVLFPQLILHSREYLFVSTSNFAYVSSLLSRFILPYTLKATACSETLFPSILCRCLISLYFHLFFGLTRKLPVLSLQLCFFLYFIATSRRSWGMR